MKKYILLFIFIFSFSYGEDYTNGKILKKIGTSLENNIRGKTYEVDGEEIKDITFYNVDIEGKKIIVEVPIYSQKEYNLKLNEGTRVVLAYEEFANGEIHYYITDIDKRFDYGLLVFLFIAFVIFLGKMKGLKALLSLVVVIAGVFYIFIPMVTKGYSPIMLATVISIFSSIITISFITGLNKKGRIAIISSVLGTLLSGLLSVYFVNRMKFTGYTTVEAIAYIDVLKNIKMKELVSAGIILGSMGAVMDVAMSISSSLFELKEKYNDITPYQLFNSGITIGKDIIGTMINTLILAYVGSSIFDILIIYINLNDLTFLRILNYEFIGTEILRSFVGSIGILAVVPIASYLYAFSKNK